jgi:prepilin-type N-terminal cleavage/methylation domain-containing protein
MQLKNSAGFTLIELSIVLVIIGLIVGGVLVGQDLIRAAYIRAQISQIEKFNTAVNTFYGKYQALPGDMNATTAQAFGFTPRGSFACEGDGDGAIGGVAVNQAGACFGFLEATGETAMFWVDLTWANGQNLGLIEGSFSTASPNVPPTATISSTGIAKYMPTAKIGNGNYICVWNNGVNYYSLSAVSTMDTIGSVSNRANIPVAVAYNIDKKTDDGMPLSGHVTVYSQSSGGSSAASFSQFPSSSTCWDYTSNTYSMSVNSGAGGNCWLSFQFQ